MGSLMAGWQTNPADAKEAFKRSTSSVTKEEVERFWRAKNETVENYRMRRTQTNADQARSILVPASPGSESGCETSGSLPGSVYGSLPITPSTAELESPSAKTPAWWQRSYWAFLNEPPVLEDRQNRYVSQFDLQAPLKMDSDAPTNMYLRHTIVFQKPDVNTADGSAT